MPCHTALRFGLSSRCLRRRVGPLVRGPSALGDAPVDGLAFGRRRAGGVGGGHGRHAGPGRQDA
ncbi:MAG: hypothetical protein ACJ72W_11460, partial [Actinoallomurus sp.]